MTFGEIISLVHNASEADRMLGVIPRLVNSAIHDIASQRSFRWMADTLDLTIPAGDRTVELPANYKEPNGGRNSLRALDNSSEGFEPWILVSKQEMLNLQKMGSASASRTACIEEIGEGTYQLRVAGTTSSPISFELDCYVFPEDLEEKADTNQFTTEADMAVIQRTLMLVYSLMPGRQAEMAQAAQQYASELQGLASDDAARRTAGRSFRMGGI